MFGKFIESALMISHLLWEAVGICLIPALLYFCYDSRKHWRKAWWYIAIAAVIFALAWRIRIGTVSVRYYMALVLPAMLLIFHLFYHGLRKWKKYSVILLLVLFALCIGRDLRTDPTQRKLLAVYEQVQQDAAQYRKPMGIVYSGGSQEGYYSGITALNVTYYADDLPELLRSLRGNLNAFYHSCDVLYIYLRIPAKYNFKDADFTSLMPDGVEIFAREYLDRRRKKELVVLKYIPRQEKIDSSRAKLLPNGDFSKKLKGDELQKKQEYFGRRAPRFLSESPELPEAFELYHSLQRRSGALAFVEKRGEKNFLRLQTSGESYMCLLTPFMPVENAQVLYFKLKANQESVLEIGREYRNPGGIHSHFLKLNIVSKSDPVEYKIVLPSGNGRNIGRIWFQLEHGDLEISDIKIEEKSL